MRLAALIILSAAVLVGRAYCEIWVVREPGLVEDTALRDGEYSEFNFGAGPLLQVGSFIGSEASAYNAVTLIRFDLCSLPCKKVSSAKLRLYKPKCFVQQKSVSIATCQVPEQYAEWKEGGSECDWDSEGASWKFRRARERWANREADGDWLKDGPLRVLDVAAASADSGHWVEFALPPELVQRWLEEPQSNSGLLLRLAKSTPQWGEHAFFYSSEHCSGKGPQLVIEGEPARHVSPQNYRRPKAVQNLPTDEKVDRWLRSDRRLARFARALDLSKEQARVFCHIDISVRCRLLIPRYKMRIALLNPKLESAADRGDEQELRKLLGEFRKAMLTYEYIHDTQWYTAGPLADVLDARQLAELYAVHIFGAMEKNAAMQGQAIWQPKTGSALQRAISENIERACRKLGLTAEQSRRIAPALAKQKRKEEEYLARFRSDFEKLKVLLKRTDSNPRELLALTKSMFYNHEVFLYYQSIYVGPRWHLLLENSPIHAFARWLVEVRRQHYDLRRVERELREAQAFL